MKIKIDGKIHNVSFWSFLKCHLIIELIIAAAIYALAFIVVGLTY